MEYTGTANREYRDRLFKFIFGNPENKEWTLSLYNAVNGSHYTDASEIKINTLDNVIYMGMKNDISFLFYFSMNFYEHQATFNPNLPVRFLVYVGMAYDKYITGAKDFHLYSSRLQKLPVPKCVCFYNGRSEKDDRIVLKLSDAFDKDTEPDVEVQVTMININYGHNMELLEMCRPLKEYSWFVDRIRTNSETVPTLEEAVDMALDELDDNSLIKPFLLLNKAEVKHMCITEYNEEKVLAEQREEAIEEGRAEGRAQGMAEGIAIGEARGRAEGVLHLLIGLVKDGLLSLSNAAERAGMTVDEFKDRTGLNTQ